MSTLKRYIAATVIVVLLFGAGACRKNFGEINTNPNVVINPDIGFLLTYSEEKMITYQYTEWIWESMEQLMRFTQHLTTDPYELTSNVNLRYGAYYRDVLPNLVEIRNQIAKRPDSTNYRKAAAITYITGILHGLKVTDMNGSIPYINATKARTENRFDPEYDSQETLFNLWLTELNTSIATLSDNSQTGQYSFGNADVFYKGDYVKWIKLANSLKLRIAARLENVDAARTASIFQQVMTDPNGPITDRADQLTYVSEEYLPFGGGGEIVYRSQRFGTTSMINFLKKVNDPRLPIYFEPNGLRGSFRDTLTKYGTTLPSFINVNDPLVQFQGGPADFTTNPTRAGYIKNAFPVGNTSAGNSVTNYFLISPVNRIFFSPEFNMPDGGEYVEVAVSAAEGCLQIAEFIQKGYAGTANTRGTMKDWYERGITASIQTMNEIAVVAGSTTGFTGNGSAEIAAYIAQPDIQLNGVNDKERIYVQQHLNFFRNPNEAFVFARRTGYPRTGSSYYGRETFNEPIPRRFWLIDPGETNRANWQTAMTEQGFTPNAQDVPSLSTQRIWYDKSAPVFGGGN
ncbi:MAG: SusD/RagB family nutrient-binding outer membrane lipoprotein [Chitinophagaceae bacterium]|nr:MAG: SusD/RagB family nutrient-binding outer membrane lipoprotein [Chitinophagaceae bacterium]